MEPFESLSIDGLNTALKELGAPSYRAFQILTWVYMRDTPSFIDMTDLPKSLRETLAQHYSPLDCSYSQRLVSKDKSRKYLVPLFDGCMVETVGIPLSDGRLSVCVSSQVGCAFECLFCATGQQGLTRDLLPGEIVKQVAIVEKDFDARVSNVVVMGQGEPFANYDNVLAALRILNHPKLFKIGARHITVSTCGLIDGIKRFTQEPEQFTLAISLHAATQDVRDIIMPRVSGQRLPQLKKALIDYSDYTGRRPSFEYALIKGVNDSPADLEALIEYVRGMLCHINLIPLNKVKGSPLGATPKSTIAYWEQQISDAGINVSVRNSRGADIAGACGQLIHQQANA